MLRSDLINVFASSCISSCRPLLGIVELVDRATMVLAMKKGMKKVQAPKKMMMKTSLKAGVKKLKMAKDLVLPL